MRCLSCLEKNKMRRKMLRTEKEKMKIHSRILSCCFYSDCLSLNLCYFYSGFLNLKKNSDSARMKILSCRKNLPIDHLKMRWSSWNMIGTPGKRSCCTRSCMSWNFLLSCNLRSNRSGCSLSDSWKSSWMNKTIPRDCLKKNCKRTIPQKNFDSKMRKVVQSYKKVSCYN